MIDPIRAGDTSREMSFFLCDASAVPETGKTASDFTAYYYRQGEAASVEITVVDAATLGTWESGGVKEVDSTGCAGLYAFGIPDAALAKGADWVVICIDETGEVPIRCEIKLTDREPYGQRLNDHRGSRI